MGINVNAQMPCLSCRKVADPADCENKNCVLWRQWFIVRWDRLRAEPFAQMENAKTEPVGVPLGGRHYAAPHQVQRYLSEDPCKDCLCPKDLCTTPCRIRRAWDAARQEVFG